MKPIISVNTSILFGEEAYTSINNFISEKKPSLIFLLVDSNTQQLCLPQFLQQISTTIPIEIIEIEPGEAYKTIDTCTATWNTLSELNADRKSLIINLGGGVITDFGGFVASTYRRGIDYINVPTSLLGMVDAAVGGKTGVNLGTVKNQIGVVNPAKMVLVDINFLASLPQNQLKSGLAEMLKHGLIYNESYWQKMSDLSKLSLADLASLIHKSIEIKNEIVTEDVYETGMRKTLNFGHTLGHAIESYFLEHAEKETLLHGEAVAIGMILAAYISHKNEQFPLEKVNEIKAVILKTFAKISFTNKEIEAIINLIKHDKKNTHGNVNFVLLKAIGKPVIDCKVSQQIIFEAFDFYAR